MIFFQGALQSDVIHPDGRHMVFHVLDALYRSVGKRDSRNNNETYVNIVEHCCSVISEQACNIQTQVMYDFILTLTLSRFEFAFDNYVITVILFVISNDSFEQ